MPGELMVTGYAGFIGGHVSAAVAARGGWGLDLVKPAQASGLRHIAGDIRCTAELRSIAERIGRPDVLIHLAASAEVMTPWAEVETLLTTNIDGTRNVVDALRPRLVVFASTCSVYGQAAVAQTDPGRQCTLPLSLYGMSKAAGEMILRDWARDSRGSVAVLRLGNIVGPGCRGLVAHLVRHMMRYPEGEVPVRLRGGGQLIRDYVPVEYAVAAMLAAAEAAWEPGEVATINVGTGRPTTNREVVEIVSGAAQRLGYHLQATYDDPPGFGEAHEIVLQAGSCEGRLGLPAPSRGDVAASIEEAVRLCLEPVSAFS